MEPEHQLPSSGPQAPKRGPRFRGAPRALLLTHSYWPEHSPPQRRWSAFAREFVRAGWQLDVITPVAHAPAGRRTRPMEEAGQAFRSQWGPHGVRIVRVPFLRHGSSALSKFADQCFSALMSVPAALLARRTDVVIATAPSLPVLAAGYLVARARRVPLVVEMRDAWPDLARDARMVKGKVKSLAEHAVEFVQKRADLVVTVTEGFAETLRERGLKNVEVISNGVVVDAVAELPQPPLERDTFRAVYLGNLGRSQRLDVAIKAAALVGDSMRLDIVGHGVEEAHLKALAQKLNAPVTFHEPVHRNEVTRFYEQADTCLVSLRDDWKSFETTVPSKTYEVLALDRHVTGIVKGEAARIIEDAKAGHLVASHPEKLAELWSHLAANRAELIRDGSSRVWVRENADHGLLARRYMGILSDLTGVAAANPWSPAEKAEAA